MRLKNIFINASLVLLGIVLSLALLEAGVRLFEKGAEKYGALSCFMPDGELGYVNIPLYRSRHITAEFNVEVDINSEGLRDYEHKGPGGGRFVILGVGDSFTFGNGSDFEDTYLRQLEKMLNGGGPSRYEVVKAGIPGYDTPSEALYLRRLVPRYHPDLVIVGFTTNDILDASTGAQRSIIAGADGHLYEKDLLYRLIAGSHLGRLLYKRGKMLLKKLKKRGRPGFAHGDSFSWDFTDAYKVDRPKYIAAGWDKIFAALKDMKDTVKGGRLLVVNIPTKEQLFPPAGSKEAGYDFLLPEKTLADYCGKSSIYYYDSTDMLREAARGGTIYWPRDFHLNPYGYKALAEGVRDYLIGGRVLENH